MLIAKHIRCDIPQLLQAHSGTWDHLVELFGIARCAGREGMAGVKEIRMMVGLDESAPIVASDPGETGRPKTNRHRSLVAIMMDINDVMAKEVFSQAEIVTVLEWEHSLR